MSEPQEPQPKFRNASLESEPNDESKTQLEAFTAEATLRYSIKDYEAAAELYSQATELQAQINGEMSSQNANLLYAYGRCLYHLALRNSDVLGSKVAGEKREERSKGAGSKKQSKKSKATAVVDGETRTAEEVVTKIVEEKDGVDEAKEEATTDRKPFFQFTGDENFDSDQDEDNINGEGENEAEEDEEDDFANAYEVLDLARILLLRRFDELQISEEALEGKGKGKATQDSQDLQQLKERLADTYDLQAEICLEGERFPTAVTDLKAALALKQELLPQSSSLIAEAHYKLSLALEFSSVTVQKDPNDETETATHAQVDEAMREDAANEMKAAISSCKLRIKEEEAQLSKSSPTKDGDTTPKVTKAAIEDVKEMVKEMEQRVSRNIFPSVAYQATDMKQLVELRQPPVSLNDPTGTGAIDGANPLSGILGSILGETPAAQEARLQEATNNATDLTNLVKRKKPAAGADDPPLDIDDGTAPPKPNGKRKVEFDEEVVEVGTGKKARLSDVDED